MRSVRSPAGVGQGRGVSFMACFRFKLWWMALRMGDKGGDIPHETPLLLLVESNCPRPGPGPMAARRRTRRAYVTLFPLVEGTLRASLEGGGAGSGGSSNELQLCVQSGPHVDLVFSTQIKIAGETISRRPLPAAIAAAIAGNRGK